MKTLMIATALTTLLTASAGFALEPPPRVPPKGTEGPDVARSIVQPIKGIEGPDVRHAGRRLPLGRFESSDI